MLVDNGYAMGWLDEIMTGMMTMTARNMAMTMMVAVIIMMMMANAVKMMTTIGIWHLTTNDE